MAAYSLDLRTRAVRACDSGMPAAAVAARFDVSLAWVYRVLQRRRDTGSIAPRKQTKFRGRALSSDEEVRLVALITARPDATLADVAARPADAGGAEHAVADDRSPRSHRQKKRYTPTSSDVLTSPPIAAGGKTPSHCTTRARTSSSMNQASRRICCAATVG